MSGNIVRFPGAHSGPNAVPEMLREALQDIENGQFPASKAILILLDDSVDPQVKVARFDTRIYTGDMRCSEGLSLLEVAKIRLLSWMGYPEGA